MSHGVGNCFGSRQKIGTPFRNHRSTELEAPAAFHARKRLRTKCRKNTEREEPAER